MTAAEFLRALQADWSRKLTEDEADSVILSAQRYRPEELETIRQAMKQLPPTTYFRPQLIDSVAQECGIWVERQRERRKYAFDVEERKGPHQCSRCEDVGLVWALVESQFDDQGHPKRKIHRVRPRSQIQGPDGVQAKGPGQYTVMGRCDCAAGLNQPSSVGKL